MGCACEAQQKERKTIQYRRVLPKGSSELNKDDCFGVILLGFASSAQPTKHAGD
ncbi:hypothetical protein [Coxiella burnetii]|uniref:Uncharacterized protein n=1 Tax=Coxiella burnetii (strain RSA 493 / Nine Mile phase I) TaxID=227377 RepID=B5QS75_COXBU|nr:hypothetical protein [Coxiella burnetii]YP_002332947.1 hypothetical protein CBU_0098a [Coxiella burnetii RSA 493]ACI15238.1 hypothetical protein CBU_0098a [Coxiella burnetii RSA 493]ACJ19162.1 hypothetical protein CbuG_1917 [Coxiella burnetii CbuG_Q212]ACJ21063.1 hypothetical protein CbuK_1956 [Coxiella burnetii CbuK_Q154]ARI65019.1 hypothetical protein B7L74_00505 [Coxiella burnetii]ARK26521.1 hypothetical protein BMW92_00500 [Coxiella burnetii]